MTTKYLMLAVLMLAVLAVAIDGQQPQPVQNGVEMKLPPPRIIGPQPREIADSSPVAKVVITEVASTPQSLYKIAVNTTLHNLTDHEITYGDVEGPFDVRFTATDERAPETAAACTIHFFSECYTGPGARHWGPIILQVPPHGTLNLGVSYLDMDYILKPGSYSVVDYFCAKQREGPECFKSNKITITIPPENQ